MFQDQLTAYNEAAKNRIQSFRLRLLVWNVDYYCELIKRNVDQEDTGI